MSITDLRAFIKSLPPARTRDMLTLLIILLAVVGAFVLGRLSVSFDHSLKIEERSAVLDAFNNVKVGEIAKDKSSFPVPSDIGSVVASRTGTKYYFPWCGSARNIQESNKIWFNSKEQAREAGYLPAANCKGLQ